MVEPLRHHKYSRKTIFRPKIVPGLHSLVVPSVMWLVLNGTTGHMGSSGDIRLKYHVVFRIWAKKSKTFLVRVNSVQIQVYVLITLPRFITFCKLPRIEVWYFFDSTVFGCTRQLYCIGFTMGNKLSIRSYFLCYW